LGPYLRREVFFLDFEPVRGDFRLAMLLPFRLARRSARSIWDQHSARCAQVKSASRFTSTISENVGR
jgi:hypothetical protein